LTGSGIGGSDGTDSGSRDGSPLRRRIDEPQRPRDSAAHRRLGDSELQVSAVGLGCNNFGRRLDLEGTAAVLEEADRVAREGGLPRFVTLQNEYSLLERGIEAEVAPACERLGVSILPYFPLYKGLLTGKYRRGERAPEGTRQAGSVPGTDEQFDVVEALRTFAERAGSR
jgi:aryl-alcohol dehydrogenase-like predicted oxidoreductase